MTEASVRGWWYGIGKTPTALDIENAAKRYAVVVLNAWETAAMRRLKALNPAVKVLAYKCLASTRSYAGAVVGAGDAPYLPTGVGYVAASKLHPEWFAVDTYGRRIQWDDYPGHWQMAVWDPAYQAAWVTAVTAEVAREGWDGVLADNDMNSLQWYSTVRFAGTTTAAATDAKLRDGLAVLLGKARQALADAGKLFIPNISESHVRPGRWTAHCGAVGGMEENAAMRQPDGVLTFGGTEFAELATAAAAGSAWLLLSTRVANARDELTGYATAALLAGPKTCWQGATTGDYRVADWSAFQGRSLGVPTGPAGRSTKGIWSRVFTAGWVAVNPTATSVAVTAPSGYASLDGSVPGVAVLAPGDALVLYPKVVAPPRVIGYRYTDPVTGVVTMLDPKDVQVVMG